jgi:hypothetical protein
MALPGMVRRRLFSLATAKIGAVESAVPPIWFADATSAIL